MKYLYLLRQAPYQNSLSREALDMVLATAAFDQQVQLLFMHDGVYQLQKNQQAELLQQKNIEKTLHAFALYDIDEIYYAKACRDKRGLQSTQLFENATALSCEDCQALINNADKVMSL